jgi:hypothetical protein
MAHQILTAVYSRTADTSDAASPGESRNPRHLLKLAPASIQSEIEYGDQP